MYKIDNSEKDILLNFKSLKIPEVFKFDYIEHMLFIELVDFDICTYLLEEKECPIAFYDEAMEEFSLFKSNIDITKLNDEAINYYEQCQKVMGVFEKYCGQK